MTTNTTPIKNTRLSQFIFFKIVAAAAILLFCTTIHATTYYSLTNGAWNTAATWATGSYAGTVSSVIPGSGDIVNIGNGRTVTVSANATCTSITIDATGVMNPSGTATVSATTGITINGTYTNQSTGAITTPSWICNGTYNHATSSATLPIGSTTSTWAANSNLNVTGSYTTATVFLNFIGQTFGNFTFNPTAMTNTVALVGAAGTTTIQGNYTITQTGSSTLYNRISGQQFASTININGNFTLTAGIYDLHNGGPTVTNDGVNLKGNFTMSGTSVLTETTTQSGSTVGITFMGSGVQTVSIASTSSITSQATTPTCAIMFTVASGSTIDMGTSVLTGTNNTSFTLSPGAGIITANTGGLSSTGTTGSIQVAGSITYSPAANYTYNGSSAQVTGTGLPSAVNNLTISNSAGVTMSTAETVNGTLALGSSSVINLNTFSLYATSMTIGGTTQSTGSYGGTGSGATHINTTNFAAGTGQVLAGVIPPMNLSYSTPNVFPTGSAITALNPTVTGSVTSYSVSPTLPVGLSLNTSTGVISGTPSTNTASATYTVTATNTGGSTTFGVVIGVWNNRYAVNAASADWNLTSTWSATSGGASGASVPAAGDVVFVGDAAVARIVTIPAGYSATCATLTIGNSTNSTANSLTFSASTSSLTVNGDVIINRSNGNGNTNALNINAGTATVNGSITLAGANTTASRINTIVITSGTLTIAGNLTFTAGAAANNVINMSGGAGTLNLAGTFSATLGTLTPGTTSTFNYNGSSQTVTDISAIAYNHLTLSGSGIKTLVAGTTSISGNLTLSGTVSATTVVNLAIGGNLTIGTGTTLTTGSTFTLGVTGTSSITGSLILAGTGAKTFTGDVTLNTGGIWNETGNAAISFAGSLTNNASFTANAGNHTFSGTSKILSGTTAIIIPTAAITGSYTNSGTFTCSTTLSGAGAITQGTTGILNIGGSSAITTLTATAAGNTVNYNGAIQTVKGTAYYNLILSGTGAKTTTTVTVNNILSMEGTSAATAAVAPTYGAAATLQYNTASTMTTGAEWITPFAATGGVIITNTGVITMNAAKVFNVSVPLTINTNAALSTNSLQLTFGGNFTNSGTFTAGSSPIIITSGMTTQSISGFTTTGNVSMTKTAGTATLQGNVNATSLTVNGVGGGILHLGTGLTHTFTGTITLTAGTLNGGSSTLNENATSATAWNGTGSLFTAGTGTVNFGGGSQTISATGTTTFNNLTFRNSGIKTVTNTVTVNGLMSMEGTATTAITGTMTYGSSATLQYKGSGAQITGNEFVSPFTGSGGVKISNSNGVTMGSARSLGVNPFTIGDVIPNSLFSDGGFQLTGTGTLNLTSGIYSVKYSSFPAFTTTNIATGTTVDYSATTAQTVKGITYSNLTISGTGNNSKIAAGDITVNGILNLSSLNYSSTQGCLDMNATPFTLYMGATATTTGTGDVTGIVSRNSFVANTPYSFGNQFTTLNMQAGGTLPSLVKVMIYITSTHAWKTNVVNRYYDFAQKDGSIGTLTTLNLHYLPGELNGNTESNLDIYDYHVSQTKLEDHGRSNFNTTDKWIGLANLTINYIAPGSGFGVKYWTLATSTAPSFTWVGGASTDWTAGPNWTGGIAPGSSDAAVIPNTANTTYAPMLPASASIGSITIQAGGILNATTGSPTLTVNGGAGAWNNLGTFNAGTSTVIFTDTGATMADPTNFYNVTVQDGGNLTLGTNNVMRIGGVLSLLGSGKLNAANNSNTVEYNGTDQTIVNPNGSTAGYSTLILSGNGTKTMPASTLNIFGDLVMNGTASATANGALNIAGNVTLSSGTTFGTSTFSHTISGNWTNNGATFTPGSGTITFNGTLTAQSINGTSANQTFNNIIVDKTSQLLSVGGSTSSLTVNNLTETSGNFTAPATLSINGNATVTTGIFTAGSTTTTITGNATLTAGTYIAGTTTNLSGNWTNNGATFTAGTGTFNFNGSSAQTIGGATSNTFNNITVNNTSGVTATADQTLNGTLNLPVANPSSIKGSLDMGSNTLYMGLNGTDTGIGDVTGNITHSHAFTINTIYTFGHPNTRLKFNDVTGQTFPTSVTLNVSIGSNITWAVTPANAVKRQFIETHTGGSGNSASIRASYLDTELASGTNESTLSFWSFVPGPNILTDQGFANYDVTQNFIALSDIDFALTPSPLYFGLAPTLNTRTWNGNISTDWNNASNWSPNGVPTPVQGVFIPDAATTTFDPSLPIGATGQYMIIESGGILNSTTGGTLQLSGSGDVWTAEPAVTGLAAGLFNAGNSTVSIVNTSGSTDITGSTDFYNLTIGNGTLLRMNIASYMGISGALTNNGILDTHTNSNTVEFKGSGQTIPNPNFSTPGYNNLVINSAASNPVWPSILNVGGTFTNNKSGLTVFSTVVMDGSSAQTIAGTSSTTFNNLTVNNPTGVTGATNLTVNGALTFISDNPATNDRGALAMATDKILDMGLNSSTTGPGEVSGIIRRAHSFAIATPYSFGDEKNNLTFAAVSGQTLPSSVSLKVTIGSTPSWSGTGLAPLNPISRIYDIIQTGGTGTRALMQVHYRHDEIPAGVIESSLSIWTHTYVAGTYYNTEAGTSGNSPDLNYVTIQDVDMAVISSTWGYFEATLAPTAISSYTWNGANSTDWTYPSNWTPNGVPDASEGAIIPNTFTTTYDPILPAAASCKSVLINAGGVLNASASGGTFTITGANASWNIESGGTFNANTSTVIFNANSSTVGDVAFNGNSDFYNLTIASGTLVRPAVDSYLQIAGTLLNNGTLAAATNENTIEFNGSSTQTIPNPNGSTPGYHNLLLSGSGTKNLPSTLNIVDEFTNNTSGIGTVVAGTGTVILNGNSIYGQTISGTALTLFNNLTIDNPSNIVTVESDIALGGTLSITSGSMMDMQTNVLNGSISSTTGTSGLLLTQNTSSIPLPTGATWNFGVVYNNQATSQTVSSGSYASLQISNPAGTITSGDINSTALTIDNGTTLDMGTFVLTGGSTNSGTGTLRTQNNSSLPIPGGKTWPGTVDYNGSSTQTAVAGTYGNMYIDNAAGVLLNDSATVNGTLLINTGNNLQINTGAKMVAQLISNNADVSGITVKSSSTSPNGNLIFHNSSDNPVPATVEMYSKASWDLTNSTPGGKYKWQYFGIPVTTLLASPMFDGDYVRQYNEAGKGSGYTADKRWIQLVNGSSLTPFMGYELTQPAGSTYSFQGQLINSDFNQTLSYTSTSDYPGEHLLSNPYTAAINIKQLTFGSDLDQTVYLYNTGSLADWTSQSGSGGNPGQYVAAPQGTAGVGGVPGQIPSMQGFLIIMNTTSPVSTTFGIPYSAVATKNNDLQRVQSIDQNADKIFTRIDVNGSRFSDKMWVFTNPNCSHGFDNGWDGSKFLGSSLAPQIYAMETDGDYQVNSVDNINNTNIGFLAGEDATYTLKFTHENSSSKYSNLYLVDLQENTTTDITQSGTTYSFSAPKTAQPVNRFKIITSPEIATNNPKTENNKLKIFNSKQTVIVQNSSDLAGKIIIVDLSGRILNTVSMKANGITTIPTNLSAGTYLVKGVTTVDESDKLIIIP